MTPPPGDHGGESHADDPHGDDPHADELPADLQPALVTGPYVFPNNNRRRIPGMIYLAIAVALLVVWLVVDGSPAVNGGFVGAALLLALAGAYSLVAGPDLAVDERDALVVAAAAAGVVAGPASAQLGWRGWTSRPTWRVLVYSAEDPPLRRAMVFVDGVDGRVVEQIVEDNPEDWSELTVSRS